MRRQEAALAGNIYLHVVPQLWGERSTVVAIKKLLLLKLRVGMALTSRPDTLVLLTQDDVHLCGDILPELRLSLAELPADWRTLHLCAGYLWGRSFEKSRLDATLPSTVPERPEWFVPQRGRRGQRLINLFAPAWPGGPLAMVIRRKDIPSLLHDLEEKTALETPDDLSLQIVARPQDFLQRGVLLCHEREQGASQNTHDRLSSRVRLSAGAIVAGTLLCVCCIRTSHARLGFTLLAATLLIAAGSLSLPRLAAHRDSALPRGQEFDPAPTKEALEAPRTCMTVGDAARAIGISQGCSGLPHRAKRLFTGLSNLFCDGGRLHGSGELTPIDPPLPAGCCCLLGSMEGKPAFFPLTAVPGNSIILSAALAMLRADRCGVTEEEALLQIPSGVVAEALSGETDIMNSNVRSTCQASLLRLHPLVQCESASAAPADASGTA
jgi:hypothetical protein